MKTILFAIILMVLLSACSSTEEVANQAKEAQTNYNTCQANYYSASELVKVELTEDGKIKSMAVGNQNLKPCLMARAPKSAMVAMVEVVGNVTTTALNVAASSVPYVAMSKIAVDGIKNAGGNTTNTDSYNAHSEANQANSKTTTSTTNTETVSGIKAGNDVDQSQQNESNPTTTESTTNTDDNSVNDSNNDSSTTAAEATEDNP